MTIQIKCSACSAKLKVRTDKSGCRLKCPACGEIILVPDVTAAESHTALTTTFDETDLANQSELDSTLDFEGLLLQSEEPAEDFTKLPPVSKRSQKNTPKSVSQNNSTADCKPPTTSRQLCGGCGKLLDPGVRYCVACGHNNFDVDVAAVSAQMGLQKRIEKLTASLGVARVLKIFSRMFR